MAPERALDVLIVGGGPAGMAAAWAASQSGAGVGLVDENPAVGGQIWRGGPAQAESRAARRWFRRISRAGVEMLTGTQVVARLQGNCLLAETAGQPRRLRYRKLILATGARELFLPFPGWTLPNVSGAGGLQSLVRAGLPISGKRVVVAGSGPLLPAVAAALRRHGAEVRLIAEQAPWRRVVRFGLGLLLRPGKLLQAARYRLTTLGADYLTDCWPVAAEGDAELTGVTLRRDGRTWTESCDYLACGFGFVPNLELPSLLGCQLRDGAVCVDSWQESTVPGVYIAGQSPGAGGVDLALLEGRIAGYAAVGRKDEAGRLLASSGRARRFARALDRAFELRDELRTLATAETVVCRCEDVVHDRLRPYDSWRAAKLQTRCGMGPCQGRVCRPAVEFLYGWRDESVRPPAFPVRLGTLAEADEPPRPATQ